MIGEATKKLLAGEDLSDADIQSVVDEVSAGGAIATQVAAFQTTLWMKGATEEESSAFEAPIGTYFLDVKDDSFVKPSSAFGEIIAMATDGHDLSRREAENAMHEILS